MIFFMKRKLSLGDYFEFAKVVLILAFAVIFLNNKFLVEDFPLYAVLIFLLAFAFSVLGFMFSKSKIQRTRLSEAVSIVSNLIFQVCVLTVFLISKIIPAYIFVIYAILNVLIVIQLIWLKRYKFSNVLNILFSYANFLFCSSAFLCFYHTICSPLHLYLLLSVAGIYFIIFVSGVVAKIMVSRKI